MRDFVLVNIGQEDSFIQKAKLLGFSELVLCYTLDDAKKFNLESKKQILESTGLKLCFAILDDTKSNSSVFPPFDRLIKLGTILNDVYGGVNFILNNEFTEEKDAIHQRRSGLNHVILAKCKEKNIEILISLVNFNALSEEKKIIVLGRIKQNIKAARRADVKYNLVSLAKKPEEMMSKSDINSFKQVLLSPLAK